MKFIFIAIEKEPPYACGFYTLSDALLTEGLELCQRGLEIYDRCMTSDTWPGYPQVLVEVK